jgi:hypothetical protein
MKNIFLIVLWITTYISSKKFKYLNYSEIENILTHLSKTCTKYLKLSDSQTDYGLNNPGTCGEAPCRTLIVYMTEFETMTVDRPQVILK